MNLHFKRLISYSVEGRPIFRGCDNPERDGIDLDQNGYIGDAKNERHYLEI